MCGSNLLVLEIMKVVGLFLFFFLIHPVSDHKCLSISFNSVRTCMSYFELRALKCSFKTQF